MSIGTITVDLLARTGSFETDINRSAKLAEKRAKEIDTAVTKAGAAVGAAFAAAGTAALVMAKNVIDGIDALNDVKDATGASIENISALEDVALRTGTTLDNVSGILVKFNNVLKEADGKNGVSVALKAIGLNAAELRKADPAEALRQAAVALSGFADDGNKARLVQELFGKSIKDAAPFLNDLAEKTQLVGKVSAEEASNAEKFNKQLADLAKNALDAKRALLNGLLPAVNDILRAFANGGVMKGLDELGERALGWTSNAQSKRIANLRKEIETLNDEAGSIKFDVFGAKGAIQRDIDAKTAELRAAERAYLNLQDKNYARQGGVTPPPGDDRPTVGVVSATDSKTGRSATPKQSELDRYIENLQKQLEKTKELTQEETLLAAVQSGRLKLGKGETIDRAMQLAKQVDGEKALNDERKRAAEFDAQLREARMRAGEGLEKEAASLLEGNEAMRQEIALVGANAEAQAALEQARLSSLIAVKEQQLAEQQNTEIFTREAAALQEQIRLLNERKDLVGLKGAAQQLADDAKKTEELSNAVGASFSSAFEKAIVDGEKLSDVLKSLAKDIAALTIRQAITVPISQQIGKFLNLGGSGGGGGGANWVEGFGNWIGGLFSGLKFANGGFPPVGKASLVGERGPELFVPNTAGRIIPNHALGAMGRGDTFVYNLTVGDVASKADVREAVVAAQAQTAGRLARSRRMGGEFA